MPALIETPETCAGSHSAFCAASIRYVPDSTTYSQTRPMGLTRLVSAIFFPVAIAGRRRDLGLVERHDILGEKVVEHGSDQSDDGQLADVVPGWSDGRAQNVGGQWEFEREQDPGREAQPDLASDQPGGLAAEDGLQQADDGLEGAEGDDQNPAAFDAERDIARDDSTVLFELRHQVHFAQSSSAKDRLREIGLGPTRMTSLRRCSR